MPQIHDGKTCIYKLYIKFLLPFIPMVLFLCLFFRFWGSDFSCDQCLVKALITSGRCFQNTSSLFSAALGIEIRQHNRQHNTWLDWKVHGFIIIMFYYRFCYSKKMISKIIMFTSEKKWMPNGRKRWKFLKNYIFCISLCLFSIPFKLHHLHVILYIHIHVHTYIYIIYTHIYAYVHNHIHIHVHIYIHTGIQCTYAHTLYYIRTYIYTLYICTYTYAHIHIHAHNSIHTHTFLCGHVIC